MKVDGIVNQHTLSGQETKQAANTLPHFRSIGSLHSLNLARFIRAEKILRKRQI